MDLSAYQVIPGAPPPPFAPALMLVLEPTKCAQNMTKGRPSWPNPLRALLSKPVPYSAIESESTI